MADENHIPAEYFPKELEPQAALNGGPVSHQPSERFTQDSGNRALATSSDYNPSEPLETDISSGESTYLGSPAGSIHTSKGNIEERSTDTVSRGARFDDESHINGVPSLNGLDSDVHYPVIIPSTTDTTLVDGSYPRSQDCSVLTSSENSEEAVFMRNAQRLARDSIRHPLELADPRYQPSPLPNGENHINGGTKDHQTNPAGTDQNQRPFREPPSASSNARSDCLTKQEEPTETSLRRPSAENQKFGGKQDHSEPSQDEISEHPNETDEVWTRQVPHSQRVNGIATRTVVFKTRTGNPVRIFNQPKQPFVSCRGLRVVNPDATSNGGADYESSDETPREPIFTFSGSGTLKLNRHEKEIESEESEGSFDKIYSGLNGNPRPYSLPTRLASASASGDYKPTNSHFDSNINGSASQFYSQTDSSPVLDTSSDSEESSSNDSLSAPGIAAITSASQEDLEEKDTQQNLDIKTTILGDQVAGTLDQLKTARWSLGLLWRTFFELLRMTFSLTFRIAASTARGVGAIFQFDLRAFSSLLKIWLQFGQVVIHTFLASTLIVTIAVGLSLIRTRLFAACKEAFSRVIQALDSAVPKFLSLRYYAAYSLLAWLSIPTNMPAPPQAGFHGVPMAEHSRHWTRSEPDSDHRVPNIQSSFGKPKSQRVSFQDTSPKPTYLRVTTQPDIQSPTKKLHWSTYPPHKHTGELADKAREMLMARGVKPTGRPAAGWMRSSQEIGSKLANY
ncbi:uncharacterized protein PgNI_08943 [Pyricularia grisea]|uniref:Uncharacterized protein n=1 Tax=Pyricularia grisea TaxID=148305 RepID=A0A6P8AUJ5_PYRGI|nr:uncharacterized protein PgNI_08943 [Pyricularia grisea]TLD05891.1 hypothetical protein PgNI_08943 [Pyricularia grisea]